MRRKRLPRRPDVRLFARQNLGETPLRADLFSIEQLTNHARTIAEEHRVCIKAAGNRLLARLDENRIILQEYHRATVRADPARCITPAAEWLLDNFYLIEEQIQTARRHLPRNYSRELPRLLAGPFEKLPRVYALALELISHVDAQVDLDYLRAFVAAYQTVNPLNLGELWAVPIMLRLGLIENLRRITARLGAGRQERDLADFWANQVEHMLENDPANLITVVGDMARAGVPTSSPFIAEFCQRLAKLPPTVQVARDWIEQRLGERGLSIEQCILSESQNQAADQVSISHTITSLRVLDAIAWEEFVEEASVVNHTLGNDPADMYQRSDFATRDSYRHSIEKIARHSAMLENEVAWKAIELSELAARENGRDDRSAHVGYYLVGKGRPKLEAAVQVAWPWRMRIEHCIRRFPLAFYLGGIGSLLGLSLLWLLGQTRGLEISGWKLIFTISASLVCLSQAAVALMNWLSMLLIKPHPLPRLDFSSGIPAEYRTMVVVPTILNSACGTGHLVEAMELHYLANRDPRIQFALLTDFCDARDEKMLGDEPLIEQLGQAVEALNQKYATERPNLFFLFHRPRRWNEAEGVWMGYERKRGKLAEFNDLLRGRGQERFSHIVGDTSNLGEIRFVITLDTDTQLPRDAARRLVGTLAHPLNRPKFQAGKEIVSEGYGILQPRVAVRLASAGRSWFVRLFAGDCGIDPYTRTVSDVYQDLFQEGSFIGKGIYDVDAFERAVHGRFPENRVLSHDLIESVHARSALVSDVEFYEDHPSRYNADANRRHRWVRGDWQIAQWLLPRVPGPEVERIANPISWLSRWKLFDNLRRSLVPTALILLVLGDWVVLPGWNGLGQLIALMVILLPAVLSILGELFNPPEQCPLPLHLRSTAKALGRQFAQAAFAVAVLPYDAYLSLDAIGRTLVRSLLTGKRLLEWQTSSEVERNARTDLAGFYATMWIAPVFCAAAGALLLATRPEHLPYAVPLLTSWIIGPWIAWWISQPISKPALELTDKQLAFLGRTARRTWRFFETFATAEENWLPPDNFQEHPTPKVAARTSPTNMGLALLANLTACDFGYLSVGQFIERTRNALTTMQRLERHRGHFFNWYDTRTLQPLSPNYVSTVDSGNLAGHLLVLSAGLTECAGRNILGPEVFRGLRDTLGVLHELMGDAPALEHLTKMVAIPPDDLMLGYTLLQEFGRQAAKIHTTIVEASNEVRWWSRALEQCCRKHMEDLIFLAPWLPMLSPPALAGSTNQSAQAIRGVVFQPASGLECRPATPQGASVAEGGIFAQLRVIPSLQQVAELDRSIGAQIEALQDPSEAGAHENAMRLGDLLAAVREGSRHARERIQLLGSADRQANELAAMDFSFLYDADRDLFTIGYNVNEHRRDASFYDLLASESRLGSYVAIAQGQVPQKHWFSLGRLLSSSHGEAVLVSWSGSMFEYLMPWLVMPTFDNTLLDQSCKAAVRAQIEYGQLRGIPWGVSESGYNLTDAQLNYQYPGIWGAWAGLQTRAWRGHGDRAVCLGDGTDG